MNRIGLYWKNATAEAVGEHGVSEAELDELEPRLESKRPTMTVLFPRISPETVGQFIYLYEVAVSYMSGLYGINTYDQPAVQLGKDATYSLMGKRGFEDLAKKIQPVAKRDRRYLV
jgi:glucose-6-phosphate isomerase